MDGERLLIAEPDSTISELAVIKLSNAGYWVVRASDGEEVMQKVAGTPPDLIILNPNLPKKDGYEVCMELKNSPLWHNIPIILLVDQFFDEDFFCQCHIKVDDILVKPFSPKTLLSRVNSLIVKFRLLKQLNPLTELPGKAQLQEKLTAKLETEEGFFLLYCDLKDFKAYNKYYGVKQGNEVIKMVAGVIAAALKNQMLLKAELFHLGGDNFCVLVRADEYTPELGNLIIHDFDQGIPSLYNEADRSRGGIVVTNRMGIIEQWPFMTLAISVVSNQHRTINDWMEAELIGLELLKYAKTMPGSRMVIDRRRS